MRIQVMSDVHVEFMRDGGRAFVESLDPSRVDVLVLAGDVGDSATIVDGLELFCRLFPHVVYVTGNHEYYRTDRDSLHRRLGALGARLPNLHWLQDRAVELDGQRFVGSTLWFPDDPDGNNAVYARFLSDFHHIEHFASWVYAANAASIEFLNGEVRPGDVVVTHHLPDARAIHPIHAGDPLNRFFLSQLPEALLGRARLWCFGHTHLSMRFAIGACDFVCNPFGYTRREENPGFDDRLVFEIVRPSPTATGRK